MYLFFSKKDFFNSCRRVNLAIRTTIERMIILTEVLCPVCRNLCQNTKWRSGSHKAVACHKCNLVFTDPLEKGNDEQVSNKMSSMTAMEYLEMMKVNAVERGKIATKIATNRLERYTLALGRIPRSICEIGPGDGAFSEAYSNLGIKYIGADINKEIVLFAQSLGRNVVLGGPDDLIGKKYDVIFFSQVLEHILEPISFLTSVKNLLTDDGIIHIEVPNNNSLTSTVRKVFPNQNEYGFIQLPHHQIAYSLKSLSYLLEVVGFVPLWIEPKGNSDQTWGQLIPSSTKNLLKSAVLNISAKFGLGSLLVYIGKS